MILTHPDHGNCDFCYSDDVEKAKKLGWREPDELQEREEKEVIKPVRRKKNVNRT